MSEDRNAGVGPILVAVDFSTCSARALAWAAELAGRIGQRLLIVHVVHDPEAAPGYYRHAQKRKKHLVRMEEAASEMMEEFLDDVRQRNPGLAALESPEVKLVVGLPVGRILDAAERSGSSQIVMGSQGRTGLSHLLLGSKAAKVVQLSPIPVTIVKDREPLTET